MKMKILMIALWSVLAIVACRKDELNNGGNSGGSSQQGEAITSLDHFWEAQRADRAKTYTITAGKNGKLITDQGAIIRYSSNTFLLNGNPVTGSVDLQFTEVYDKGDMMAMGLNTMGRDLDGTYAPMVSAGEFYLEASQNGQPLTFQRNNLPYVSTAPFPSADWNNNMLALTLESDPQLGDSVWVPIDSIPLGDCGDSTQVNIGENTYCFQIGNNASWTNCDYFMSWTTPLTSITVNLPSTHDEVNTDVLLSFNGMNIITQLFAPAGSSTFEVPNGYQVPVGQAINLVVIAEQNGVLVHHIQALTIANNQTVTLTASDMVGITATNLQTLLSNLP